MTRLRSLPSVAPTGSSDWRRMAVAVRRSVARPPVALASGLAGLAYLSLFALPGNLAAIRVVLASDLPVARKLTSVVAFYPPYSPLYGPIDTVLIAGLAVLVAANVAVLIHRVGTDRTPESGGPTGVAMLGGVLGAGCGACGSLIVPVAGVSAAVAVLPLGGLELTLASVVLLVFVLSSSSRHCAFDAAGCS